MVVVALLTLMKIDFGKKKEGEEVVLESSERRAVFVSYLEYNTYLSGQSVDKMKEKITSMFDQLKENGFNMILAHVRSHADSIYPSKYFKKAKFLENTDFDLLEFMVDEAHRRNMEFHAWINPYRISGDSKVSFTKEDMYPYTWQNTNKIKRIEGKGVFFNPASSEVRDLVKNGVLEIIENYKIDGIHFDDYFYPSNDIDLLEYLEAKRLGKTTDLESFHFEQVNLLVKEVYQLIKTKNNKILFGVSPEGNMENNYQLNFVDVKKWASEGGYVDYLMPQIYFGFENERKPFAKVLQEWQDIITNDKVKLMVALAFYKVGATDTYAMSGRDEWILNDDVIKKEIIMSRNIKNYLGFSLFRYGYLFDDSLKTKTTGKELENVVNLLIQK